MNKEDKWFVMECNKDYYLCSDPIIKSIDLDIGVGEHISKIIMPENLSKFFDLTKTVLEKGVVFGWELCVITSKGGIQVLDFALIERGDRYILTAFSSYLGLYEDLLRENNELLNSLREKMKTMSITIQNYSDIGIINSELMTMQRELSKKNNEISRLLANEEKLNLQLIKANKTKDRIFSIIGHDLRSPLSSIIDMINYIGTEESSFHMLVEEGVFTNLKDTLDNTMLLLENLLNWSRSQIGEFHYLPMRFNLVEVCKQNIFHQKQLASRKGIVFVEDYDDSVFFYGDSRMIGTVVRNIVSNAIKFSNKNGRIWIHIKTLSDKPCIVVEDEGIGMTSDYLEKINKSEEVISISGTEGEKGTGFGLSLCKNLISENKGEISIESLVNKGTKITIKLMP